MQNRLVVGSYISDADDAWQRRLQAWKAPRALTPSFFGMSGRAMPRRGRRVNRHGRDNHHRPGHLHAGWRNSTSGNEP